MILAVNGIATGCIYALIGLGVVLTYRASGIVNFAQSAILMVGGYTYLFTSEQTGAPYLQLLATIAAGIVVGIVFYIFTGLLMRKAAEIVIVIGTLAIWTILEAGASLRYGDTPRFVSGWAFGGKTFDFDGSKVPLNSVLIVAATIGIAIGLHYFLIKTKYGSAFRAVAEDRYRAAVTGIPVSRVLILSWVLGGVLATVAGLLISPVTQVYPAMGDSVLFPAFFAAVIGGFGSIPGCVIGGIFLGLATNYIDAYIGGGLDQLIIFLILLPLLAFRPRGLLAGVKMREH